ncbi:MAG TPA: Calx-beta domain-containing protein, partial [Chloroflexaceae bacterium]|nr:Calx-beta domain-containing protein [Chloroflexaceae bacterium]
MRTEGAPGETRLMTFTVSLSRQASGTVTVRYATVASSGPTAATPGADFTPVSGLLTFSPGQQQQTFQVPIVGDAIVEYDEIFGVQLSSPSGAVIAVGSATGTIVNDDLAVARLEPQDQRVREGDTPSTTSVNFDIVISNTLILERPVSVSYATREVAGGAVGTGPNRDFIATSGTLTFNPGGPTRQLFTITIVGDDTPEPDEEFLVDLTPGLAATIAPPATGRVVIENDDQPGVRIGNAPTVLEGDAGTTDAVFTVTRVGPATQDVTVQYITVDGTATAPADYLPPSPSPGTVVIPASPAASATVQIRIPVVGDTEDEIDEDFFVELVSATNADILNARGRAVIDDDDGPTVSLTTIAGSAVEGTPPGAGGTLQFSVQPSAASPQDVIVTYEVVGSGPNPATLTGPNADIVPPSPLTFTFPANTAPAPRLITIPIVPDDRVEPDETLTVRIVSVVDGFPGTPSSATGTILLDDYVDVGLAISASSVIERNAGTNTPVGVTVSLSRPAPAPVSVGLGVGGTATPGSDFTLSPTTVNIPAGQTTGSATITVIGDGLVERDETVVLSLTSPSQPYLRLATGGQTLTILDDDSATVTIGNASMLEGNGPGTTDMVFPVTINPVPTFPVTITWATQATGTATPGSDYVASSGTVTLGGSVGSGTVSVPIVGDLAVERDETFQVALSGPVPPRIILPGPATGTILNDDAVAVSFDKTGTSSDGWFPGSSGATDEATWTITVVNTGTTSVNVALTDDFGALPYPIITIDSSATINGGAAGTPPSSLGSTVSWSGTLPPGAQLNLSMDVFLDLGSDLPPPCVEVVNPSYQISVDGSPPSSFLNEAPVSVGDCVASLTAVSPQAGKRSAVLSSSDTILYTPTPTASPTPTPTDEPTATPTATSTPRPTATDEPTPTLTPTEEPTATPTATKTPKPTATDEPEP